MVVAKLLTEAGSFKRAAKAGMWAATDDGAADDDATSSLMASLW